MNKIYFVRHAKPDCSIHDDLTTLTLISTLIPLEEYKM